MTKAVKTVRIDARIKEAIQKMNKFNMGSVVVMNMKRPVGMVTERYITVS
jgi:CBS domain-containing protein